MNLPGITGQGIEIFVDDNQQINAIYQGKTCNFYDLPEVIIYFFQIKYIKDAEGRRGLDILKIKQPKQRFEQWLKCRFGGYNKTPDFAFGKLSNDFFHCDRRGKCPAEGIICKLYTKNGTKISGAELRIIRLVSEGYTDKEIANKLHLSWHTVQNHRRNIYEKIGGYSQVHICNLAHELGIKQ